MANDQFINTRELAGLELAKYVLVRITDGSQTIEKIAENFDNDRRLILWIVDFLKKVGWIKQNESGTYRMTRKGKANIITRERPLVDFGSR